ncbi:hypothetical protein [Paraburkholderia fynbosensis]|uniref:hypothetical protein n=1 Tax=Paraburkholderia fynbosensis TaxID=1200993 RepID=UPI0031B6194F
MRDQRWVDTRVARDFPHAGRVESTLCEGVPGISQEDVGTDGSTVRRSSTGALFLDQLGSA